MKKAILLFVILISSLALKAQECDSAAYIFFGDFDALHVCAKSLKKMDEKYWGIAYDLGAFSIRDSKNKVLFDFNSPGGDNYEVYCFNDSIIIYERFYLPFLMDEAPYIGQRVRGPRNIYKYILTKSTSGYSVKKENVYKDLIITPDSLKRVKLELRKKIDTYNEIFNSDYEVYVQKHGEAPQSLFDGLSDGNFYWLVFLGYYNDDKECEMYLKDWDRYIPMKCTNPEKHATVIKNILWYKTLKSKK